jgi:AAA domain
MGNDDRKVIEEFARLLAQTEDPTQRARFVKQAELLGAKEVPKSAFEPPVMSLGQYLDTPIEIPPSLVWPTIVVRREITTTLGRAGKGKTTMNINRILKWACGRPMFDGFTDPKDPDKTFLSPDKPLKALILENEGSAGMFHQKLGTLLYNCGDLLSDDDRDLIRENVFIWGDGGYSGLKLDDDKGVSNLRAGIEKCEPDIVFIEPFRQLWRGEENSATDMAVVVDNILGMGADYDCGFILSHHERKGGAGEDDLMSAGRGSTVLEGAVACMENFQSVKGGDFRQITWSKSRYLQPPPSVRLQYDPDTGWYAYVPESDLERAILEALEIQDEPINQTGLADILDEKPASVGKKLKVLVDEDRITRLGSVSGPGGSTGYRYTSKSNDPSDGGGGLGF